MIFCKVVSYKDTIVQDSGSLGVSTRSSGEIADFTYDFFAPKTNYDLLEIAGIELPSILKDDYESGLGLGDDDAPDTDKLVEEIKNMKIESAFPDELEELSFVGIGSGFYEVEESYFSENNYDFGVKNLDFMSSTSLKESSQLFKDDPTVKVMANNNTVVIEYSDAKSTASVTDDGVVFKYTEKGGEAVVREMSYDEALHNADDMVSRFLSTGTLDLALALNKFCLILDAKGKINPKAKDLAKLIKQLANAEVKNLLLESEQDFSDAMITALKELKNTTQSEPVYTQNIFQEGLDKAAEVMEKANFDSQEPSGSLYGDTVNNAGAEYSSQATNNEQVENAQNEADISDGVMKANNVKMLKKKAAADVEIMKDVLKDAA